MRGKWLCLASMMMSSAAVAAVPVQDSPHGTTETGIADCMKKARKYKDDTLKPSQGITGSVKSPGTGSQPTQAGASDVSGSTVQPSDNVGNIDVSPVNSYGPESVGGMSVKSSAQSIATSQTAANALSSNKSGLQSAGGSIGGLDPIQGAWNQNSVARIGNVSVWNQAIQVETTIQNLMTQRLIRAVNAQSADAQMMRFDPALVTLVEASRRAQEDDSERSSVETPPYGAVSKQLEAVQQQGIAAQGGGK